MGGQVAEVLHIMEDGQVIGGRGRRRPPAGGGRGPVCAGGVGGGGGRCWAGRRGVAASSESSSALDALLSAVTELGAARQGEGAGEEAQGGAEALTTNVEVEVRKVEGGAEGTYAQTTQDGEGSLEEEQAKERHTGEQVVEGVVQEVLQFAASQLMMKEGLTQVIVNDEGTHYIVTELDGSTLQVEGTVYTQSSEGQEGGAGADQTLGGLVVYSEAPCQDPIMEG
ncbi:hypothetical protein SKAU_G00215960 [Synaphobranchus kaupii]|uniref:Uncharacterized protein n=1 Tax=Synaphobranchus kaupii TaxID=118154 RepID=A0A9Q1F9T6_SYNKA|nr:hypothetical protein SKAU_G00215960 [Synaphobranchus kaupii]